MGAPRPLNKAELQRQPSGPGDDIVQPPQRPVDFLRLAEAPLFEFLGGSPARLVNAAAMLEIAPPTKRNNVDVLPRTVSADASAGPSRPGAMEDDETLRARAQVHSTRRRVRLLRPDGRARDEWLPRTASIAQVLKDHCPKELRGAASIFVAGFHSPPDSLL